MGTVGSSQADHAVPKATIAEAFRCVGAGSQPQGDGQISIGFQRRVRLWPTRLHGQCCFEIAALFPEALNRENALSQAHGKAHDVPPLVVNNQKDQVTVLLDSL
jgi:hypothetical protein